MICRRGPEVNGLGPARRKSTLVVIKTFPKRIAMEASVRETTSSIPSFLTDRNPTGDRVPPRKRRGRLEASPRVGPIGSLSRCRHQSLRDLTGLDILHAQIAVDHTVGPGT